ncbi:S8 family serine peptidase [Longimicrobium sp.]|uniref:S8 family serine peptidase n=1 Tax=Longimicrobium sp. TaxID=2029185 RepID=UPI002BBBB9EF|nr:S8 family serine peptidase [Longimicrobium sp.]HSU12752.1 S8 family serine peptidase [Longimicrobium sp.]
MKPNQLRRGALLRLVPAGVALLAAACTDRNDPPLAPSALSPAAATSQAGDFYYYGDRRITLEVDPTQLSVESALPPQAAARAVLATMGMDVRGVTALPQAPGHWLLAVSGGDAVRARAAARALRADPRFAFAANVFRGAGTDSRVVLLDRVAVRLQDGATRADVAKLNAEYGTRVVREPVEAEPDVWWLAYPRGGDPLEIAARLEEDPRVRWADADKVQDRRLMAVPTDPFFGDEYYARSTQTVNGVRVDINAVPAWDLTLGAWAPSAGPFLLAVVDDGVDTSHPDLGYINSWGYNAFIGQFEWTYSGCTSCSLSPGGSYSHGTHVSGVINAQHNNGIGLAGIAPAAAIISVRIFDDNGAPASDNQIAQALNTAWYNGAQVMNNSWGGGLESTAITTAIGRAVTEGRGGKGTVMVFAAGNTSRRSAGSIGGVQYPGTLSNVLTVSAINRSGTPTDYAPDGAAIDVVAPSGHTTGRCIGDVVTIDIVGSRGCNDGPGGSIDYSGTFSGTSAAAPQAASVAAMVLSRNGTLTELQVRDRIKAGADPWGTANTYGAGKLNAYRALVGRVSGSISGPAFFSTPGTGTWTANPSGGLGGYTYQWEVSEDNGLSWQALGTAQTQVYGVIENDVLRLRVTVRDAGTDDHRATSTIIVRGPATDEDGNLCPPSTRAC